MPSSSSPAQNSSKQQTKRQRSDTSESSSNFFCFFFVCLCQNTCPPPHLASIDNNKVKKTRATWARHLCFRLTTNRREAKPGFLHFRKMLDCNSPAFKYNFTCAVLLLPFNHVHHFPFQNTLPSERNSF
uniref:(northern house mosquito) hypothetical protein n=1 Tax=Culex pipiens TaxID=7175 RepID=A0A8D8P1I0_CULPI